MEKRIIILALIIIFGCGIFLAAPRLYRIYADGRDFYAQRLPGYFHPDDSQTNSLQQEEEKTEEPVSFDFYDVRGEYHEAELDINAAPNSYLMDRFVKTEGLLSYEDDGYLTKQGIDVSAHQGDIDWNKVARSGIDFAIIRCGFRGYGKNSGVIKPDSFFEQNYKGATEAGLDVGVYFFSQAINEKEALEEADFVLKSLEGKNLALPIVFDPESILDDESRTDEVTGEQFTKNSVAFCNRIKEAGYSPMIYANLMWQAYLLDMSELKEYPFWYADYTDSPQTPYDFSVVQYTENGTVSGIAGAVDRNLLIIQK